MGFDITIDGVSVATKCLKDSLTIDDRIEARSVAYFTLVDETASDTYNKGQAVAIYDDETELCFGGFIDTSAEEYISSKTGKFYKIQCVDNHYLADKRIAAEAYESHIDVTGIATTEAFGTAVVTNA